MHMLDRERSFLGSTPILSSGVPIAAGIAMTEKFRGTDLIAVVYVGDGASEEGPVYETLNLAAVFNLPLLVVLEDNLYSVNSPQSARRASEFDMKAVVEGLGVRYFSADGNSYENVHYVGKEAVDFVRSSSKPAMIHCRVFRHMAHSSPLMDDHLGYRREDTLDSRDQNDSLAKLRAQIVATVGSERAVQQVEREVDVEVGKALEDAVLSPEPTSDQLLAGVYAD
jgi:pyruvate dehydrogenase E1 component alpha subunit